MSKVELFFFTVHDVEERQSCVMVWKPHRSIKGGLGQKFNRKVYQQWQHKNNKLEPVVLTRIFYSSDPVDNSTKKKKKGIF
jgi:hypothetical protein